ncbi:MAG: tetratricopeptide repeat protein [Aquabacterium sp.]
MDRHEARLRRSPFLMRDPALNTYLTGLACKLGGDHCPDIRVYPVRTPYFNASMAPNGMMQIWSGLLLRVDNEAQLASVIGHEIGHYLERHSLLQLQDLRSRTAAMAIFAFLGGVGLIGQLALAAGAPAFSRDQERDADRIGIALIRRGGWDAREAAKVWSQLRQELTAGAGGDPAKKSVMFATHPGADERQALLAELAGQEGGVTHDEAFQRLMDPHLPMLIDDELKRAQYEETITLMTRLHQRRPERGDLLYARGEARRLGGKVEETPAALADFQSALQLKSAPAQTYRAIGLIERQAGRKAEAVQAFERYLREAPDAPDAALIQSFVKEST